MSRPDARTVLIPEGLHGGIEIFTPPCTEVGLDLVTYDQGLLQSGEGRESLYKKNPALFVVPTSYRPDRKEMEKIDGRVLAFGSVSTGSDHMDEALLKKWSVPFFHAPGANAASVAQYVLVAISGLFSDDEIFRDDFRVGIVGKGHTGSALAKYLNKMDIPYCYFDTDPAKQHEPNFSSIIEALESTVVTFHVPLTDVGAIPTRAMVQGDFLGHILSQSRAVINTSRGKIFTGESYFAIVQNLRSVMDVFPEEPPLHQYLNHPRFLSPHVAGYNYEARIEGTFRLARAFFKTAGYDGPIPSVNKKVDHYNIINSLAEETSLLKSHPESFLSRRNHYPMRGDFSDAIRLRLNVSSMFLQRALEVH